MEVIRGLIIRLRHGGVLLLVGVLLIMYIALGFLYLQQGAQQKEYEEQIAKLSLVVAKPLPSAEELKAKYDGVNRALAPISDVEAIALLVSIAEKNGIDVNESSGKFRVPTASVSPVRMGGGAYRVLSFGGIYVQGDYDKVMAFLSDLDSGKTLATMVLMRVITGEVEVTFVGEEGDRRAEFRSVASAVLAMMTDNGLARIPNPISFIKGSATNHMGDDPKTTLVVEGFPDIMTTAAEKGYTGTGSPRNGYVLYNHAKISTDNTTQFKTVSYDVPVLTTKYYYTCEADGSVRQFDGANVARATEYVSREASQIEFAATVDVNIYFK